MFLGLLTDASTASNHTKCASLSNKKCMTQPTIINLHHNECIQGLHYYPFAVNLDRCVRSCNTLNDLSNKVRAPNETEELNRSIFNMITGINDMKTLTKYTSWEWECKFENVNEKCKYNSYQKWNNDKCFLRAQTTYMSKRLYLESCYIKLQIW